MKSQRTLNTTFQTIEGVEAHNAKVRAKRHGQHTETGQSAIGCAWIDPPKVDQTKPYVDNLEIKIPGLKIISEANNRDHWAKAAKRHAAHKLQAQTACYQLFPRLGFDLPIRVRLVRIGPRLMDDDNLANGFKAVRDGIAAALNIDDGDTARIKFEYEQFAVGKREYAIRIEVRKI